LKNKKRKTATGNRTALNEYQPQKFKIFKNISLILVVNAGKQNKQSSSPQRFSKYFLGFDEQKYKTANKQQKLAEVL